MRVINFRITIIIILLNVRWQITWYREGVVIEQSERFTTELRTELGQPHHSTLTILKAQVADSATYRVVVRNEFGETEVSISLVVAGKCAVARPACCSTLRRRRCVTKVWGDGGLGFWAPKRASDSSVKMPFLFER